MREAFTDGACRGGNPGFCSCAWVLYEGENLRHKAGRVLDGLRTNNTAEYTALVDFLLWAEETATRNVVIYCDSMLVVEQVNQRWKCDKPELKVFMNLAYGLLIRGSHMLKYIKGHAGIKGNEEADALCNVLLNERQNEKT